MWEIMFIIPMFHFCFHQYDFTSIRKTTSLKKNFHSIANPICDKMKTENEYVKFYSSFVERLFFYKQICIR